MAATGRRGPRTAAMAASSDCARPLGMGALTSANALARVFADGRTRALFAGIAAHGMLPLDCRPTAAVGLVLNVDGARGRMGDPARRRAAVVERARRAPALARRRDRGRS